MIEKAVCEDTSFLSWLNNRDSEITFSSEINEQSSMSVAVSVRNKSLESM